MDLLLFLGRRWLSHLAVDVLTSRWHLHSKRKDAALHFATAQPDLSTVLQTEVLADDESEPDALIVHLVDIFQFAKLLEE